MSPTLGQNSKAGPERETILSPVSHSGRAAPLRVYSPGRLSDGLKTLSGVQGRSTGRGSGDEVSQKLKEFADIVYRFSL